MKRRLAAGTAILLAVVSLWFLRRSGWMGADATPAEGRTVYAVAPPTAVPRVVFRPYAVSSSPSLRVAAGKAVDALTEAPVPGVSLLAFDSSGEELAASKSDESGEFVLAGDGTKIRRIVASSAGYAPEEVRVPRFPLTIRLRKAPEVIGIVRADSRLLQGVAVSCRRSLSVTADDATVSNAEGAFVLDGCSAGAIDVVAKHEELGLTLRSLSIEPGERKTIELVYGLSSHVTGTVSYENGRPAAACDVAAVLTEPAFAVLSHTLCGPSGEFDLGAISIEKSLIVAAYDDAGRATDKQIGPGARGPIRLILGEGLQSRGRVVFRGTGIAGALIEVTRMPVPNPARASYVREGINAATRRGAFRRIVTSGIDGSFLLDGLESGSYSLYATAEGYAPSMASAVAGNDLILEMTPSSSGIEGTVDGDQSQRALVRLCERKQGGDLNVTMIETTSGMFAFGPLSPGDYVLTASLEHDGDPDPISISLPPAQTAVAEMRQSESVIELHGEIRSIDGNPIPGVIVGIAQPACDPAGEIWVKPEFGTATTTSSGEFRLQHARAQGRLFVQRSGFVTQAISYSGNSSLNVTLVPGDSDDYVDLGNPPASP